ncbi:NAD(P)/FAD-dependent oxidoreductase [Candidatus Syntrophosphaera thermopropionivorans]|uniref:FAD-binding oxidoreductase n=1 Tax=Candidatus Syntrophosphaera thermopropionivorans TaxID=2593015 RepID=A0AC61QIL9_9BACT|nr:FAD-binding oxidoreductase [Candidatus Syntrophosphaera thermopropionivorans]TDF72794.1 FAD-binding oxidoreductase [Candidatus Syntrophosphaera thermopropionivorans]HOL33466.1 FAD-binding oxidoreductase [Candidatus Syntrophosphaera thermopropionivorans]HPQ30458.1 FAD-binding oxidoreductase [Candidatus Syntrophosphaera thermopropionivorans]
MDNIYDVIIIGAGSIGVPTALNLALQKQKVLVIDGESAPGQQNNKKAIGGVRATHSDYGKINVCKRSIEIMKTWKETWGDDIGWMSNGYSYPAYTEEDEKTLKDLMKVQHSYGLNITWVSPEEYNELVPGINKEGLRGSTYSPEDGSCSPLLLGSAYYFHSLEAKVQYRFREKVIGFDMSQSKIEKVITDKGTYSTGMVINAAGNYGKEIAAMAGLNLPVQPENHEAGITEPVARFMGPMVVDMRIRPGSENFYFYQNNEGQIVFCITPKPPITGIDNRSTSVFLPMCTKRMLEVYPRLHSLRVRRTWRGQYPMTPDGFPIVGKSGDNLINAIGMCGQGFMLGPGLGELITRICLDELTESDLHILQSFNPERDFSGMEAFK